MMRRCTVLILLLLALLAAPLANGQAEERWRGIDEAVIEKFALEHGRTAAEPLLPIEGDLLLFFFALAGAAGGFIMGYYWHKIFIAGRTGQRKDGS
jgi:cobalt/nickel transport protein